MKKQKGFSLIELLIVVAIILIIAAIAIPNLLRSKIAANESSAVGSVRTIGTAEVTYSSTYGTGFSINLLNLGGPAPCTIASATQACLIDPLLSVTQAKSGYDFNAAATYQDAKTLIWNGFEIAAWPSAYQVSGVRAFCDDQSGVVKFMDGKNQPPVTQDACANVPTNPGVSGPVGN